MIILSTGTSLLGTVENHGKKMVKITAHFQENRQKSRQFI